MNLTEIYLIALTIIFAVPWLVWRVLNTEHWMPLAVVQIVGGVLLGPGVLGAAFPDYYAFVFKPDVIGALNGVAWWAVMLFVWVAGLELDLKLAWERRAESGITAACALFVPMALGCGAAAILLASGPGWIGPKGSTWQIIVGIGMACAVTALPILALLMEKLGILREPLGQRILRYASLDDVAIWGVLALILLDWERIERQGIFLAGFAVAAFLIRKLMVRLKDSDRWYVGLIWLAVVGLGADWSGLHYMVGAFLAGVVLDAKWFGHEAMDRFRNTVLLTIMPVFFLSTGLRTQWDVGGLAVFGAAALLLAASVSGKLLGIQIAGKLLGWRPGEASIIGWLLQTKALIEIIFANVLLDKGIISNEAFTALLLMAVTSTMLTVPMVAPRLRKAGEALKAKA
ncbi:MAG: cation:proton antiporter [Porphyrobacter sp.]|jgi:Kef-type K+ transport system membrane component KefB|nr:cation:proton antiporter [Porphyrobacter sp.]